MNRETVPDEDTQTETYRTIVEAMGGDPVAIRVLDWGGEKDIEALASAGIVPEVADANPALGLRGIRLLLRQTGAAGDAVRRHPARRDRGAGAGDAADGHHGRRGARGARACTNGWRGGCAGAASASPRSCRRSGIMIETPGAALSADALALEADFFAIGTNDLTAYTLAVDRGETDVAELYDPLHPAVLRLVQFATEAALRMRMPVSVCGEMAANPRLTPLLLGLGLRSFSMNASAVPRVKQAVAVGRDRRLRPVCPARDGTVGSGEDRGTGGRLQPPAVGLRCATHLSSARTECAARSISRQRTASQDAMTRRRNASSGSSGRPRMAECSPSIASNRCTPRPSSR